MPCGNCKYWYAHPEWAPEGHKLCNYPQPHWYKDWAGPASAGGYCRGWERYWPSALQAEVAAREELEAIIIHELGVGELPIEGEGSRVAALEDAREAAERRAERAEQALAKATR